MNRIALLALTLATSTGCLFVDRDVRRDPVVPPVVVVNAAPYILEATSGCYYDAYNVDDVWYFDAIVDDADGALDVTQVWADVYDEQTGYLVESFPLDPTTDPTYWTSEWLVSTSNLDCWYPLYVIDVVAYDTFEDYDIITIYPDTYR